MSGSPLSEELQVLAAGYVLNNLDDKQVVEVEKMMVENIALREEIQQLQAIMATIAQEVPPITPPPHLKDRVLQAAAKKFEQQTSKSFFRRNALALIAILVGIGLAIDNLRLRQQINFAQKEELAKVASLLQSRNTRLVSLTGTQENQQAGGTVLLTSGKWEEVVISLQDLPSLSEQKIYRLWLTFDNQQTIFCGEFNTDKSGTVFTRLRFPETAPSGKKPIAFALTADRFIYPAKPTTNLVMSGAI
jgi:anti-sigma-K factor RskA